MSDDNQNLEQMIKDRLAALPLVVRNAIESSEIQKNLRKMSETYKLHVDQWESLEEEVMMTLLGIDPIEELQQNIVSEVGIDNDTATKLTQSISEVVFEPIRQELERQLEHPDARAKEVSGVEAARNEALAGAKPEAPAISLAQTAPEPVASAAAAPPIAPATPPQPVPEVKVTRPSESTAYKPGETSAERATVHDDPYREPPV